MVVMTRDRIEEESEESMASRLLDRDDLMPSLDAARDILHVAPSTLTGLLASGELPSVVNPLDRRITLVSRADAEALARRIHPTWMTAEEAADRLVVSVEEIGEMVREGLLPAKPSGRPGLLVSEASVDALARRLYGGKSE